MGSVPVTPRRLSKIGRGRELLSGSLFFVANVITCQSSRERNFSFDAGFSLFLSKGYGEKVRVM